MKKLLAAAVVLSGLAMLAGTVKAATTADLTITVTPFGTKSIAIAPASYDFGTLAVAVSSVSATAVAVDNDGTGPMQVGMQLTSAGGTWTAGAAPGVDTLNLRAIFNTTGDARPADGAFTSDDDLISAAAVVLANGTNFSGTTTAQNLPPTGPASTKDLWLRIDMPTNTTVTAQQSIVVQLSAN